MKQFFCCCIFLLSLSASAQRFEITGKVVDKQDGSPLEAATLYMEHLKDSSLVSYTISDKEGRFVIEGSSSADTLRLSGSYSGYLPLERTLVMDREQIDLGEVEMEVSNNLLGEVTVVATRAPVTLKTDTLEFNAGSFNTRQNANLEDVMKKLPGVEVDAQGSITVNGKPVTRILVNGKEFFGNDPLIATKNLPKEIIDKIQVVDTKTKAEEFTGKAGDPDNKTINITIKEDKNRGYFARATVGGGTDERYELSGIANYFQDDMRVSILASGNNINSSGFSYDEVFDAMGRSGRRFARNSGGSGITKSETAGFNFTNEWDKKFEVNADYFFGRNDTKTESIVERENFLPDNTYFSNAESKGNVQNDNHRANASFEIEFDTLTKLSFRPGVSINEGFSSRIRQEKTFDEDRTLANSSSTMTNGKRNSSSLDNRLNFIRRFGKRGAYLQANLQQESDRSENEDLFISERITYQDEQQEVDSQNQFIHEEDEEDQFGFGITQRSVLADNFFLDLSYDFNTETSTNIRNVYDFEDATERRVFNDTLSNAFEVKSLRHIPNVGLNYEGEKLRTNLDVGLLYTSLKNEDLMEDTSFDRSFNNLYIRSNIRYEIKSGTSAHFSYSTNSSIPSIREMQPVADITDPLNIVVGNPQLNPTYTHDFSLNFQNFDFATRSGFGAYASANLMEDQVVSVTITDPETFVRTTTFTNVDGGFSSYVGTFYNKRIKKDITEFSYRLGANANYGKQVGFTNGIRYNASRLGIGPSIRLRYNYNELVDLNPRYELNYVFSDFDISNNREEEYINHSVGFEATTYWPENVVFGNEISYNYFGNIAASGFDPTSFLWNMSLGYQFFDEEATLKIKVYDLLNENVGTSRSTGRDYVQDTQELILEQYFMLSFTYKLSQFGGREQSNRGGGRF